MSMLTPQMDAILAGDRALVTLLIEVLIPDHPLQLLVGSGTVAWGDKVFADQDPVFGTLASLDVIEDGAGDDAPSFTFSMFPSSDSAAAEISSPDFQESEVRVWLAAVSPATGLVIPDPDLLFFGLLDLPTWMPDKSVREVEFECVSAFELLMEGDEGALLSDSFHEAIWPGETGFANITGIEENIYWGLATPPSGSVTTPNRTYLADGNFS